MSKHNVNEVTSDAHFQQLLEGRSASVLNFWASWAEPCKDMNQVFEELSRKYPSLHFIQLEAESFPDISEHYEIAAVPTFILLKSGTPIERIEGANAPALAAAVAKFAKSITSTTPSTSFPPTPTTTSKGKDLTTRLQELIKAHPVMVFIKGTPQQPRCGFSRQLVELLGKVEVKYGSFDILADEEVRQGLKEFSNWPTYPQVYVNGELIGGLDILKEMIESGEFQKLAPAEEDLNTRLKKLINKSKVMVSLPFPFLRIPSPSREQFDQHMSSLSLSYQLFMKGDPTTPKCGFSRQITALLKEQGVVYDTFDILEDEEVRQGLKTYSDWPTYPQLYIHGELVGGLDIVKEMVETGELKEVLA
ncbi:thioredoxin-like protein [Fimicolochytrium jonesii]|uniref:thioredoxin-like protein n=1 Tax=Fimicolochytrium jonesii TaxID=1396493 RepID=UPI0022FE9882|nr:thioredoxin-like protein [Fimicolochytrium jonesii]KAI8816605.1 thioredoxin-like protein [Fimicolochytrium jonesii]